MQLASELAIAAIEKNGGVVTTAFYDPRSLGKCSLVGLRKLISISSDQGSMCVIQGSPRSWSQRVVSLSMYSTGPTSKLQRHGRKATLQSLLLLLQTDTVLQLKDLSDVLNNRRPRGPSLSPRTVKASRPTNQSLPCTLTKQKM